MSTPTSSEELLFGLALAGADAIGIRRYYRQREIHGSAETAFLRTVPITEQHGLLDAARATVRDARERGVTIVAEYEAAYPESLRTLRDAPPHLFAIGDLTLLQRPAAAIVGTRSATPYGMRVTRMLAEHLARAGVAIVSGMARGIDAAAHEAALQAEGGTIAVLGTGVDIPYPRSNTRLHREIAERGLILSELPCGTRAFPGSFPRRNRLIAGLVRAVIVTQAPVRSGALITSGVALDIGRDVAVVPGPIDVPASVGSNRMLRDGAAPILEIADALSLCGITSDVVDPVRRAPHNLSDDALLLWRALTASGPLSADALARVGGLEARRAAPALAALEIAGWVEIDHAGVIFAR